MQLTTTVAPSAASQSELVRQHLPLVHKIARHYALRSQAELEDLVQVGSMGLVHAIRRFRPELGNRFETYATALISGEIRHYLRDSLSPVRAPRELCELVPAIKTAETRLRQTTGQEPTVSAISRATGVDPTKVGEVLALDRVTKPLSLDATYDPDESRSWGVLEPQAPGPSVAIEDRLMLEQAIAKLRPDSRRVINGFFYQDLSQQEIGQRLGVSQAQISKRIRMAVRELFGLLTSTEVRPAGRRLARRS